MSASHHGDHFIERNWGFGLILFGIIFVTLLVSFAPVVS